MSRRTVTHEYRAPLDNGTTLRIVAVSIQKAYTRATQWADRNGAKVLNVYKIED
jgi:hypothetical protein